MFKQCGQHQSVSYKTNSPCARQHDNLGLLDSFGDEVFDDLADDQGAHEGVLSCEQMHTSNVWEHQTKLKVRLIMFSYNLNGGTGF